MQFYERQMDLLRPIDSGLVGAAGALDSGLCFCDAGPLEQRDCRGFNGLTGALVDGRKKQFVKLWQR